MAWIEVHQALRDHRKVLALADMLDMAEPHVVGHMTYLWLWALDNAPDGQLPDSTRIIARAAGYQGDAATFVSCCVDVGFFEQDADGHYHIHDWNDYAGNLIEKRKANAARQRAFRERHANAPDEPTPPPPSVDDSPRNAHVTVTSQPRNGATVPNPTVPNPTQPAAAHTPRLPAREAKGSRPEPSTPPPSPYADLAEQVRLAARFPGDLSDEVAEFAEQCHAKGIDLVKLGKAWGKDCREQNKNLSSKGFKRWILVALDHPEELTRYRADKSAPPAQAPRTFGTVKPVPGQVKTDTTPRQTAPIDWKIA